MAKATQTVKVTTTKVRTVKPSGQQGNTVARCKNCGKFVKKS